MKEKGYITTAGKHHYIMITDKAKVSVYMIAAFARKIAEVRELPPEKLAALLQNRDAMKEMRKRIERCTIELCENSAGKYYHIEAGKAERPHMISNCPIEDNMVIVFRETKAQPIIHDYYKEG